MTEPTGQPEAGYAASTKPEELVDGPEERANPEVGDAISTAPPDELEPVRVLGRRRPRRRTPGLIVAAFLVGAGVFLALRGMQQVVARAPATPVPVPTPIATTAPASILGPATPPPQPTPLPTSSALILFP
jgi:hypothetical protein